MGMNLQDKIETLLDNYFKDLDGEKPNDVYNMFLHSVEKPLLIYIMNYAQGNQTRAAKILGLNRNTLRKKLEFYNLNY
jgi:Fis family transcriptional regulator